MTTYVVFIIYETTCVVYRSHMKQSVKPSPAETAILQILWARQSCSVKAIHEELSRMKSVGYTTILKQVQRMHGKGLVSRSPGEGKSYDYQAVIGEADTKSRLFDQFVNTAFEGSWLCENSLGNASISVDLI